uniref:HMA domain-containing protein n=1 Tax=Brassica campestris TaxID=3711 RepID=M4DPH8_BRACM
MKKKNITAIVKELNVRMKKEPITLRYIHILVSVVFFSSAASLLFLLALYFNQQFQTSLFLVKDFSSNPLTSLPPPHSSGNDVADEELMRRAEMASRGVVMNETNPKVAFMFLTRWNLPLSPLWEMFFKGHEGFYSIYVHSSPEFTEEPLESSVFYKKRIPSKAVEWGESSMIDAERRLLSHAILEPSNARFVILSETCIPLFNFTTVYTYLMRATSSFLGSFDDPRPIGRGRYNPRMFPHLSLSDWRKGNQWFEISRKVAAEIVSDHRYYALFKENCRPPCYMDEHYLPTLVNKICPEMNSNRTVTSSFISAKAMEVKKANRKKTNEHVGRRDLNEPKSRNQYSFSKSIKENEKMVEEMEQQMLQLERKITEKKMYHEKAISTLKYNMRFGRIYNEKWARIEDDQYSFQSDCLKKMELDKITFANNAYRDKKAVASFSSGKREINVHNLNHRMLHEAKSMDGERSLLKMLNPSKDDDSDQFSINQIEDQMWKLQRWMKWPEYNNNPGTMDREECERKVKELEWEKYQGFVNAPCKASLWNSLPSTKVLRNQIQAMETRDEEKRKIVLVSLLKIESPTSGWVKPLKDLLKTIDGVDFKIDKRSKTVYIYGKTNPEIILEKIAKAGQKAEIIWSNHERKKPLDNQRGHPMQQCNNYHQQYYNGPPPPWMYQQPLPYQSYALPPPYPLQLNPPPPLPVPSGSQPKEPAAKSFPPTPPPPKNFTMGDLHPGCGIM